MSNVRLFTRFCLHALSYDPCLRLLNGNNVHSLEYHPPLLAAR
jgi:hypothetical protein